MSYRVLVVDDERVVRRGISDQLEGSEFSVVAQANDGKEADEVFRSRNIDLIILDFKLPGDAEFAFLKSRMDHSQRIPLIVFSSCENPIFINQLYELKVNGILNKSASPQKLLCCLRQVVVGESLWTREQMRKVSGALNAKRVGLTVDAALTHRECDVLRGMCRGLTNKEIARDLVISYETVKEHVQHILRKIGVIDRTQAAIWAVREGIVGFLDLPAQRHRQRHAMPAANLTNPVPPLHFDKTRQF